MPIAAFAHWLKGAGVQLMYLSCSRSSSGAAALELAASNVPMTIGFNWDLDDRKAVDFAREFYSELLKAWPQVSTAFGKARRTLYHMHERGDPIWAAPVLIAQTQK
jgi:CHAT domain-containing protein